MRLLCVGGEEHGDLCRQFPGGAPALGKAVQGSAHGAKFAIYRKLVLEAVTELVFLDQGGLDIHEFAVVGGGLVLHAQFQDGAGETFGFHVGVACAGSAEKLGAGLLKPYGINRMMDNAHLVGFGVTHFDSCSVFVATSFHGLSFGQLGRRDAFYCTKCNYKGNPCQVGVHGHAFRFADEDVWMTQVQLAELYDTTRQNIGQHIDNIYKDDDLPKEATIKKFFIVQKEGSREVRRELDHYNLDVIIAIGYRVQSPVATRFRTWATTRLHEFIQKGFALDDERLKNGHNRYFKELLQRIRDIRSSERNFYQQVTDIYATAVDYDPRKKITLE